MAAYTDYDFYVNTFLGVAIALSDFERLALRASEIIDELTFEQAAAVITAGTDTATIELIEKATCAVAEEFYKIDATGGEVIKSESVGRHSVTYATPRSTEKRVTKAAKRYLWNTELMYGGVGIADEE